MGRWAPDARGRLEQAAMELYEARGFDATTVADIAARAGLTERTFFRHFADKREVLFSGATALQRFLIDQVERAPDPVTPVDMIVGALDAAASAFFTGGSDFARRRQAIITANAELQERELIKLATLAAALADTLRRRGVTDPAAGLAAETGMAVFRIAFEAWVADPDQESLAAHIRVTADELRAMAGGRPPHAGPDSVSKSLPRPG